jgi:hypothetical protein
MLIGPDQAKWVLENCFHPGQRNRMKTGRINILRHVVRLRRDRWIPGSQITFGKLPDGRLILLNGYHRISAIVEFGGSALFNVQIRPAHDEAEIDSFYSQFDRAKDSRARPVEQSNNALHIDGALGVSKTMAKSLLQSVILIQNGFSPVRHKDRESLVEFDSVEDRLALAMKWVPEANILDAIWAKSGGVLRRKLFTPSVMTVALATLRAQPLKATAFWTSVAGNDGLRSGTPEHCLVNWLLTYRLATPSDGMVGAALAWNAFYHGRGLTMLKIGATTGVRIGGTKIDLRGRR